ncbi:unnamed protein product, partial [Brassica napus]
MRVPSPLLQLKLSVNVQDLCSGSTSVDLSSAILLLMMIPEAAHQKLIVQTCSR